MNLKYFLSIFIFLNLITSQTEAALFRLPPCDKLYVVEMQNILNELKNELQVNLLKPAQEYMIMLKQHEDLGTRIFHYEEEVFNSYLAARLRAPLLAYSRCKQNLVSGTH